MDSTQIRDDITAVKAAIAHYGWTRGQYVKWDGGKPCGLCLVGALMYVETCEMPQYYTGPGGQRSLNDAKFYLSRTLKFYSNERTLSGFNDSCESVEQLFEFLDAAVAALDPEVKNDN